ncbi:hypothetical protein PsYK624_091990 [Phanerochaete sordida]|uniref:Uncharacterized protein n=1 Tax=Phanerochaete sordida TaxID=48140 RepID=A0A9P3LF82_9APHY|nr:hypothetical protein PsYK624_091990 [Phanerochaete sordida]
MCSPLIRVTLAAAAHAAPSCTTKTVCCVRPVSACGGTRAVDCAPVTSVVVEAVPPARVCCCSVPAQDPCATTCK